MLGLATDQLASRFTLGEAFAHRQVMKKGNPMACGEVSLDPERPPAPIFSRTGAIGKPTKVSSDNV